MLVEKAQPVLGDEALEVIVVPSACRECIAEFVKVTRCLDADGKEVCAVATVEIAAKADAIASLHTFAEGFDLRDGVIEGCALFESVGVEELAEEVEADDAAALADGADQSVGEVALILALEGGAAA